MSACSCAPDLANPVFAPIVAGVEAALAERQYAVLVAHARNDMRALELVEGLAARRGEGLILATAHADDPVLARLIELGLPTVLVNRGDPDGRFSAVTPDDREGMRLIVRHLVELGTSAHRRLRRTAGRLDRLRGPRASERDGRGRDWLRNLLHRGSHAYTREAGEVAAERLMARDGALTAIAAANDLIALSLAAVAARGLSCPDDISVSGHNDMPLVDGGAAAADHDPHLPRPDRPEGARLLLDRIAWPEAAPAQDPHHAGTDRAAPRLP